MEDQHMHRTLPILLSLMLAVPAAALADPAPQKSAHGEPVLKQNGKASYYGDKFNGRKTASGKRFDQNGMTAASKTLPLGTKATVTDKDTGKSVNVTVTDRGPHAKGRVMDVSKKAAQKLEMTHDGVDPVTVEARPSQQPNPEIRRKIEEKATAQK